MEETCYGRDILPWTLVFCFLWWGGVAGGGGETMLSMALCERYSDLLTRNMISNMHGDEKMLYSTFLNRYIWINHEYAYAIYIRELSLFLHLYEYWTGGGRFLELIVDLLPFVSELWVVYRYPIAGNMSQPERDAVCGKLLAWHVVSLKCCFGQGDYCEIGNHLANLVHFLISI